MKSLLLLCFTLICSIAGMCQRNYKWETCQGNCKWEFRGWGVNGGAFWEWHILVNGDTRDGYNMEQYQGDGKGMPPYSGKDSKGVMDVKWKDGRVLMKKEDYMTLIEPPSYDLDRILGNKDYTPYKETDDGYLVLYDFNMQVGDAFPHVEGYEDIVVTHIDYMTTRDGVIRKLLTLSNGYHVLEGIGCLDSPGLFYFYLNPAQNPEDWDVIRLKTFQTLNSERKWEAIYKEYDESSLAVESRYYQNSSADAPVFDLQGRRLNGVPQRGMYIRDGRKYVVK